MAGLKHSPLPWHHEPLFPNCVWSSKTWIATTSTDSSEPDKREANARLIVQAVNEREGLIEALKQLVSQCENLPHQGNIEGPFAYSLNKAKAAIRLAEKSE